MTTSVGHSLRVTYKEGLKDNMPFKKANRGKCRGKYVSPSGKCFTKKQVSLYYATDGTFKKSKK